MSTDTVGRGPPQAGLTFGKKRHIASPPLPPPQKKDVTFLCNDTVPNRYLSHFFKVRTVPVVWGFPHSRYTYLTHISLVI
jgi:hypothetical protein